MRRFFYILSALIISWPVAGQVVLAQDISRQGGDLTSDLPGRASIQVNAPNVTDETRRLFQLEGFRQFHRVFIKGDGLGPDFVNASCGRCHVDNGKGQAKVSKTNRAGSSMIVKISLRGLRADGSPKPVPGLGDQVQDQSLSKRKVALQLTWTEKVGRYPDGTRYKLRRPNLSLKLAKASSRKILTSLRMTPPIIGPGLLEAVPDSVILEYADADDANGDGISGRPNYVPVVRTGQTALGRFGFRASHTNVEEQTAAALFSDIGITNPIVFQQGREPELGEEPMKLLVLYQKLAGVPRAVRQDEPLILRGKEMFQQVGCDDCHRMTLRTENYSDPELSNQEFHPFTDLLLHDMGTGLADKRPEFGATGREWKTTPLWGLGLISRLRGGKVPYLHDGRARTVEEAILWHGGEAARSLQAFRNLPKGDRAALISFLHSL